MKEDEVEGEVEEEEMDCWRSCRLKGLFIEDTKQYQ